MRFTSLSINIHIIDKERRKYSAHFMMWLNSYLGFILKEPNGEDVQWVKMITSDVVDPNKKIISKAKEIRLEF
ncbi:hypothetical protein ET31_08650 [Geobacillus stearothermophilus]|nr:hypothetical protein ET31_14300 [Geobacillus stearothermophilus]KFL16060.1 hypothetical protein ET31_08650 [Geobacillus stearothermophilus]